MLSIQRFLTVAIALLLDDGKKQPCYRSLTTSSGKKWKVGPEGGARAKAMLSPKPLTESKCPDFTGLADMWTLRARSREVCEC